VAADAEGAGGKQGGNEVEGGRRVRMATRRGACVQWSWQEADSGPSSNDSVLTNGAAHKPAVQSVETDNGVRKLLLDCAVRCRMCICVCNVACGGVCCMCIMNMCM